MSSSVVSGVFLVDLERLQVELIKRGLTLTEAASAAHLDPDTLSQVLYGQTIPAFKTIEILSDTLGLRVSDLLLTEGDHQQILDAAIVLFPGLPDELAHIARAGRATAG